MKTIKTLLILLLSSFAIITSAQTNISGLISTNTTWTLANSPYIVTGAVLVNTGVTLSIEAGVTVKFDTSTSLQINGELIARGMPNNKIIFTANKLNPKAGDWGNINFNDISVDAAADINGNYLSGSIIEYATIEWGGGNAVNGLVQVQKSFPYISNCIIKNGKSNGIYAFFQVSGGPFYVLNNTIAFNKNYGIYINDRAPVVIKGNIIYSNFAGVNYMNAGVFMGSPLIFQHNILAKNGEDTFSSSAITWTDSYLNISYNSFISNKCRYVINPIYDYQNPASIMNNTFYSNNAEMLVLYNYPHVFKNNNLMYNNCTYYLGNQLSVSASEDATNNWWGTVINSEISSRIYDWNDNNSLQIINYIPFINSPDTIAPISPPRGLLKDTLSNNLIVKWNKNIESDLAGYKIYYGPSDGIIFSNSIDVGIDTSYTLTGVGLNDLVLVTAYDNLKDDINDMTEGHESWYSNDVLPSAKITNGDSIEICQNENIILRANKNNSHTYQWIRDSLAIPGATADTCLVSLSGYYQVIVTNVTNNADTSNMYHVEIHQLILQNGNDVVVCGASITLTPSILYIGDNSISYSWNTDSTLSDTAIQNPIASTIISHIYYLSITDNVCSANASYNITVSPLTADAGIDKTIICGDSAMLSTNTNYTGTGTLTYAWSPSTGLSDTTIANPFAAVTSYQQYSVSVTTSSGCLATDNVNVSLIPMDAIQICIVGVDSTNKNIIVWNKPLSSAIDSFFIYRETGTTGIYQNIGSISYDSVSVFVDTTSFPDVQSNKYKISVFDDCNLESAQSDYHKTMHLTINQGMGNTWNLIWEPYVGFTVSSYRIYRGTAPDNLQQIGNTTSGSTQFTDQTPPAGFVYYQVEVISPNSCNPSKSFNSSRSNIASNNPSEIPDNSSESELFTIYPNPANDKIEISVAEHSQIQIMNIEGQLLKTVIADENNVSIDISGFAKGLYFLKVRTEKGIAVKKFIKE